MPLLLCRLRSHYKDGIWTRNITKGKKKNKKKKKEGGGKKVGEKGVLGSFAFDDLIFGIIDQPYHNGMASLH